MHVCRDTSESTVICEGACGNCKRDIDAEDTIDLSEHSKALISIIEDAKQLYVKHLWIESVRRNSPRNLFRERRLTLKQLIDEFKSRKFAQQWTELDPTIAALSRSACDSLVINLLLRWDILCITSRHISKTDPLL